MDHKFVGYGYRVGWLVGDKKVVQKGYKHVQVCSSSLLLFPGREWQFLPCGCLFNNNGHKGKVMVTCRAGTTMAHSPKRENQSPITAHLREEAKQNQQMPTMPWKAHVPTFKSQ